MTGVPVGKQEQGEVELLEGLPEWLGARKPPPLPLTPALASQQPGGGGGKHEALSCQVSKVLTDVTGPGAM